jgi:hypothetical protein
MSTDDRHDDATIAACDAVVAAVYEKEAYGKLRAGLQSMAFVGVDDAESIIEAAIVEVHRQIRTGRVIENPIGLVHWKAYMLAKGLAKHRGETLDIDDVEVAARGELDDMLREELPQWRALVAQLNQKRPRQVMNVMLGGLEQGLGLLHIETVAEHLGISAGAAEIAFDRACKSLKAMATDHGLVRALQDGTFTALD